MLPRVMIARRFKRSVIAAAIGLLSIFALSGCVKMDIALSVEGDKVNGTMIVGVDKQVLELSNQSEEEAEKSEKDVLVEIRDLLASQRGA